MAELHDLSHIDNWIFDLDNTLYSANVSFFDQIDRKMTDYISRYLALNPIEARMLQKDYLAEYGTSLSGLMAVHGMDPAEFLDYVHDVDLSALQPDPILKQKIHALPGRKFIYTNGSKKHAYNVASHLDLFELFDASFGIEDADYVPKPKRSPYIKFCDQFDIDPNKAIFFEDSARNLEVPKFMGMSTVLIQSKPSSRPSGAMAAEPHEAALQNPDRKPDYIDYFTDNLTQWLPLYP